MQIDKLIPISRDSQVGALVTAYNSADALFVRAFELTFNLATRTSRDLLFYEALTLTGKHVDTKKIEAEEITAAKAYVGDLATYLQDRQAKDNISTLAPRFYKNLASGGAKNSWSIYEDNTEISTISTSALPSFPALESLIKELNPIWTLQDPYTLNNLPSSQFLAWGPSLKVTEADTLRKSLADNADLFENFCGKLSISLKPLNIESFRSGAVPQIKLFDYTDYRWLFWAFTGLWLLSTEDDGTVVHHYPSISGNTPENIDAEGDETWLTDGAFGYIVPQKADSGKDGEPEFQQPSALNAIIKILYPYYGTDNPLGGVTPTMSDDTLNLDITGNDKSCLGCIAKNDVSGGDAHKAFAMVGHSDLKKLFPIATGVFVSDDTHGLNKIFDADSNQWILNTAEFLGGQRYLTFSPNVWNATYNKERAFMINVLTKAAGTGRKSTRKPRDNKKKTERNKRDDADEQK